MSVITVVTRIFPVTAQYEESTNLLKPSDLGKTIEVHKCFVVDPRTGQKFSLETTFCLGKTKDLSCLNIPGLIPVTSLDCAVKNVKNFGREFAFSVPRNIPVHKIPQLCNFTEINELESSNKPSIKLHLNLKQIREATKRKSLIRKREKFVRPLLKYFINNECLICGIILNESRKSKIMYHMFSHIKLGLYACGICDKYFPTAEALYSHSIEHPGEIEYTCKLCNDKCSRKFFLSKHYEKKHHNELNRKPNHLVTGFVCSVCKVKLTSWKSIVYHKNAHFGKESYICLFCNKAFTPSFRFLRYHSHIHFIPESHKCKYCLKIFLSRCRLREHEKLHRTKLQHMCEICGKRFNFRYSLWRHIQLHSQN